MEHDDRKGIGRRHMLKVAGMGAVGAEGVAGRCHASVRSGRRYDAIAVRAYVQGHGGDGEVPFSDRLIQGIVAAL